MDKTKAIIRSLGFLDFLSYHEDLTLPASRSSSTCCLFQVVDPFLVGAFLFQQVMPSSSNRKVLWLNFFCIISRAFLPTFLHNLPRWVFFCPDWVSFCPEYYLQPLFFTQPSHTLFEAPSHPFSWPELESGQNELPTSTVWAIWTPTGQNVWKMGQTLLEVSKKKLFMKVLMVWWKLSNVYVGLVGPFLRHQGLIIAVWLSDREPILTEQDASIIISLLEINKVLIWFARPSNNIYKAISSFWISIFFLYTWTCKEEIV